MYIRRTALLLLLAIVLLAQLTACSKTVKWEEEVILNTGEIVWVERTVNYSIKGGAGNPLDIAYRPDSKQKTTFKWGGKDYSYEGDAMLLLLAVTPQRIPVLVARASDSDWHYANNYKCTAPFYVQFSPDSSGHTWTWPPAIEPWLIGLPRNLLLSREAPGNMQKRYTAKEKIVVDGPLSTSLARIDQDHISRSCFR